MANYEYNANYELVNYCGKSFKVGTEGWKDFIYEFVSSFPRK